MQQLEGLPVSKASKFSHYLDEVSFETRGKKVSKYIYVAFFTKHHYYIFFLFLFIVTCIESISRWIAFWNILNCSVPTFGFGQD